MEIVISLKDLGFIILIILLIILVIYMINVTRNLVVTIKKTNKILEDTEVITGIASERAKEANAAVGDLTEALATISSVLKGNQSMIKAVTNAFNAFAGLKGIFTSKDNKDN